MAADTEDKLLAEWFWTDRWMGSSAFLLPMEPRGVYREMLTQAWRRQCRLPNDPVAIQRAIGSTAEEWARCWPVVSPYWRVEGDHLVNDTQLQVYAKFLAARDASRERAAHAANIRWERERAEAERRARGWPDARALLEHMPGQCPPSPSPTPTNYPHPPTPAPSGAGASAQLGLPLLVSVGRTPFDRIAARARQLGMPTPRKWRRRIRQELREGVTEAACIAALEREAQEQLGDDWAREIDEARVKAHLIGQRQRAGTGS